MHKRKVESLPEQMLVHFLCRIVEIKPETERLTGPSVAIPLETGIYVCNCKLEKESVKTLLTGIQNVKETTTWKQFEFAKFSIASAVKIHWDLFKWNPKDAFECTTKQKMV